MCVGEGVFASDGAMVVGSLIGSTVGRNVGIQEAKPVGEIVGNANGCSEGMLVGGVTGEALGLEEGKRLGRWVPVGELLLGLLVGCEEILGAIDGKEEGREVGEITRMIEGLSEGAVVVGRSVGAFEGTREGSGKKCATLSGRICVNGSRARE